jgi:predicted nucleic acid-binding protein
MAVDGPVFLDTSVLVAGLIELGDASQEAERIFDAIRSNKLGRPLTAWHCCLELYSVATRLPGELRLQPSDARELVAVNVLARFDVHDLPESGRSTFLELAAAERIAGGRVYDAHIAEVARLAGAKTVVTDNRRHLVGLMRFGIKVMATGEFAVREREETRNSGQFVDVTSVPAS